MTTRQKVRLKTGHTMTAGEFVNRNRAGVAVLDVSPPTVDGSAFDAYYANPSPTRALALAIADLRAGSSPEWDFIAHLDTALDHCKAFDMLPHGAASDLLRKVPR